MDNSDFFHMDRVEDRVAEGVDAMGDDGGWVRGIYSCPPVGSPDGGAHVTASDLERFLVAAQRGQLLSEGSTSAFFGPVVKHSDKDGGELHFGYGLEFQFGGGGELRYYEKEGFNAGVSAVLRHYPSTSTTVVLLCNTSRSAWEPREHIDSLLTAEFS
jgi:CubicO group peptidase (beta-lactamase class C family)